MKIIVTITDPDTLEEYENWDEERILRDFIQHPLPWIAAGHLKVEKE